MLNATQYILSKYQFIFVIILGMTFGGLTAHQAHTQDLDAGAVLNKMETKQQSAFVTGIIQGLAYARFLKDKPNEDGFRCVSGWLNGESKGNWRKILTMFERHATKPPAVLLHVLIKKDCGA